MNERGRWQNWVDWYLLLDFIRWWKSFWINFYKLLWLLKIVEYKFISTARLEFPFLSPILKLCNKIHLVENLLKIKFQLYEMGTRNEYKHVKYLLVNRKIKVISTWFDAKRTTSSLVNLWHRLRILMSWKWCFAW